MRGHLGSPLVDPRGRMGRQKIDTRAIGLDVGLSFVRWLTGAEHLHFGLWDGLEVTAGNLRAAQDAYSARLFALVPTGRPLRILDIGGGAGATAAKLIALGHSVQIVVPSPFLASRCRVNAPAAMVHECLFEDFAGQGPFDLCLFSESYQYIPLDQGLAKALRLLTPDGQIVIGDCFRSAGFQSGNGRATVGGGHSLAKFRALLASLPVTISAEQDVSASVAPSIDLEQRLFHVFGHGLTRINQEMAAKRPVRWRAARFVLDRFLGQRQRLRLGQRFLETTRTSEIFLANNCYMFFRLDRLAA
jgi:SAM-dependent methyltransferase